LGNDCRDCVNLAQDFGWRSLSWRKLAKASGGAVHVETDTLMRPGHCTLAASANSF
jgi:hypothetical protein